MKRAGVLAWAATVNVGNCYGCRALLCQLAALAHPQYAALQEPRARLAGRLGCSVDTIDRHMRELRAADLVIVYGQRTPSGDHDSSVYVLNWPGASPLPDFYLLYSAEGDETVRRLLEAG